MSTTVAGIAIPDSSIAREAQELVRNAADEMLFNHSSRVFLFGALKGLHRGLRTDLEQLYIAAMFHDLGLTERYRASTQRFELDGADAVREFLLAHERPESDARKAWLAIALHTTPEVPNALEPEIALLTAGVETDVLGMQLEQISVADRDAVVTAFPRPDFKNTILGAFYMGMAHRPASTFGTMNDDVLAHFDPTFRRGDFVSSIALSAWPE